MRLLSLILCTYLLLFAGQSQASVDAVVLQDVQRYDLSHRMRFYEDVSNQKTIEGMISSPDWVVSNRANTSFGYSDSAYWIHVPLKVEHSALWYVWLRYAAHDDIKYYWVQDGKVVGFQQTGDLHPYSQRDVMVHNYAFSRLLNAGETMNVYMRVKTAGSYRIPLEIRQKASFEQASSEAVAFHGVYYGVLAVMSIYNLVLYFITGLRPYLYYVFYVFTSIFSRAALDGTGFKFVWGDYPDVNLWIIPVSFWCSAMMFGIFSYSFLNIQKAGGKIRWYFLFILGLGLLLGTGMYSLGYQKSVGLLTLFGSTLLLSALAVSVYLALGGRKYAGIFAIATMMSALAYLFTVLEAAGAYTDQTLALYSYPMARMFEIVLFAIALGVRIRFLQSRRHEAEQEALHSQEESLKNLELYERLYDSAMTGNFVLNSEGDIQSANRTFFDIFHEKQQANGQLKIANIQQYFLINIKNDVLSLCSAHKPKIEKELKSLNGVWVSIMVNKVNLNSDHVYECSIIDITHRIRAKELEERAEQDKMQALQQLVVGVSHEINTPLGIVKTSCDFANGRFHAIETAIENERLSKELCLKELKDGEDALLLSDQNVDRMANLIRSFKQVSVEQMGYKVSKLDVQNIISRLEIDASKLEMPLKIQLDLSNDLAFITFNEALYKVLYEILVNAHEHSDRDQGVNLKLQQTDRGLFVHMRDYGEGVDDESLPHIFEPFFTTGRGIENKLGLGLYQVQNIIVQLLQGEIKAYNKEGLNFDIYLPNPDIHSENAEPQTP